MACLPQPSTGSHGFPNQLFQCIPWLWVQVEGPHSFLGHSHLVLLARSHIVYRSTCNQQKHGGILSPKFRQHNLKSGAIPRLYWGISWYRDTLKSSILMGFSRIIHYKPSIWGCPHCRKTSIYQLFFTRDCYRWLDDQTSPGCFEPAWFPRRERPMKRSEQLRNERLQTCHWHSVIAMSQRGPATNPCNIVKSIYCLRQFQRFLSSNSTLGIYI